MELKDKTYWLVHLRNGVSLYTEQEFHLDQHEEAVKYRCLIGLDGEFYEFPQETIMLVHRSTPESRTFYVRLTVGINEEMMNAKQGLMEEVQERIQDGVARDSAVDRVTRSIRSPLPGYTGPVKS